MCKISRIEVFNSVWLIVKAVRLTNELAIAYPDSYVGQQIIAFEFQQNSSIGINICAGAVDGLLIWTTKPSKRDLELLKIGEKKFFCGRKKKFGLNLQAVCDSNRKFLFVELSHPGATSDYLAFARCQLNRKLDTKGRPFMCPGLAIFGDNAYENTSYLVTPFKGATSGAKDAFNFYQSQLRITIECAFGMLVHRWGLLRKPMPINISIHKTQKLVYCLCQLHNYCISCNESAVTQELSSDMHTIMAEGGLLLNNFSPDTQRLDELLDGGNSRRDTLRRDRRGHEQDASLPAHVLLHKIQEEGHCRPQMHSRQA
jgi:hypothetical protein